MEIPVQNINATLQSIKFDVNKVPGIEAIELELYNALSDSKGVIREMCSHILNAGGKRIRPLLVLYSGLVFLGPVEQLLQAASAAELIHMASLVHDDIIDNSYLRRSRPSINKVWGNHFAVLCGDYLFAKAFGILSGNRLIKSMDLMVEAIKQMCHGEILQACERYNFNATIESYYDIIAKKTAIFLQCCCKSGAIISGASEVEVQLIGEYGLNLGYAFQIIDDILDFCGKVDTTGKPRCEDIRQGNITLPTFLLLSDGRYGQWIKDIIGSRNFTGQVLDEIVGIMNDSRVISESFRIAESHIEKAKQCLMLLPDSHHVVFLAELADILKVRAN